MNISEILQLKFPLADFRKDILLQDDGKGVYIKEWNLAATPIPTQEDLDRWSIELANEYELQQVLLKRKSEYPSEPELLIALWEKVVENRPEVSNVLQAKRLAVKAKYPKPE